MDVTVIEETLDVKLEMTVLKQLLPVRLWLCSLSVVAWSPQSGDSCESWVHKTTMRGMVLAVA